MRISPFVVAVCLLAAACGSSDDDASTAGSSTTPSTPAGTDAPTTSASTAPTTAAAPSTTTTAPALALELNGLEVLGDGFVYEAWVVVDEEPVSAGVFTDPTTPVVLDGARAADAGAVVITIETDPDPDPAPSASKVLAGDLVDGVAMLAIDHPAAVATGFAEARGAYILATPTDGTGPAENERSGVWWTDVPRAQSLFLPELGEGWIYESWVVIDGAPVTGGTFRDPFAADDAAPFSGPEEGPPLVGEDYLLNAPDGLAFPVDLRGMTAVISVEPVPDDSPDPFALKVLVGDIPADAIDHTVYQQANVSADAPSGVAVVG